MKNFFCNTRWTLVRHAGDHNHPEADKALEELIQLYWYPIYAYIRHEGYRHHDAEDLVQGFLSYACENRTLARADASKGRFRTFVLACLRSYLYDELRKKNALKRGGQATHLSRDDENLPAAERYQMEPVDDLTPAKLFERKLAEEIVNGALQELASETSAEIFDALKGFITEEGKVETYRMLSSRLGLSVSDLKSKAHRLRLRYREIIKERALDLVDNENDLKNELVILDGSLRGAGKHEYQPF